jgi:hypothetical protein
VVEVPLPAAEVQLDGTLDPGDGPVPTGEEVAAVHDAVRAAIATAGPGGTPSTSVRVVTTDQASPGAFRLRVGVPVAGTARISRADGTAIVADVPDAAGANARLVASRLEHLASWELIRSLGDHPSALAGAVTLDLFEARKDETRRPADRQPLATDGSCVLEFAARADGGWDRPAVFMELHNHADRDLFVAVLDLTDRFRCHPVVQTEQLAAGRRLAINQGQPITASLPDGVEPTSGAKVRDWLKVIVSDVDFEASSFTMQQLDDPPPPQTRSAGPRSTIDRLAGKAVRRDLGGDPSDDTPIAEWSASTLVLEVRVP